MSRWAIFVGTMGIFMTLFLTFARFLPVVAIAEVKHILKTAGDQYIAKYGEEDRKEAEAKTGVGPHLIGALHDKDAQ
jgi:hypothetical protein